MCTPCTLCTNGDSAPSVAHVLCFDMALPFRLDQARNGWIHASRASQVPTVGGSTNPSASIRASASPTLCRPRGFLRSERLPDLFTSEKNETMARVDDLVPAWSTFPWFIVFRGPQVWTPLYVVILVTTDSGYRGTSLIRNCLVLGPYSRLVPRTLRWS